MGIIQEGAILVGDLFTQPIRRRMAEMSMGQKFKIQKVVEVGAVMGDGSFRPDIGPGGAIAEAFRTGDVVEVAEYGVKIVHWDLVPIEKK